MYRTTTHLQGREGNTTPTGHHYSYIYHYTYKSSSVQITVARQTAGVYKTISSAAGANKQRYRGATIPEGTPLSTWPLPEICDDT